MHASLQYIYSMPLEFAAPWTASSALNTEPIRGDADEMSCLGVYTQDELRRRGSNQYRLDRGRIMMNQILTKVRVCALPLAVCWYVTV